MSELQLVPTPWGRFLLRPSDCLSRELMRGNFWDPYLQPYFDRLGPDDVAVDVGAYLGFYTVYLAHRCRQVVALEPQRKMFYQLCGNLAVNVCENVLAYCLAAFDRTAWLWAGDYQQVGVSPDVTRAPNAAGLAFVPVPDGQKWNDPMREVVPARRLDDLIAPPVHLLKVDAQGCDLAALRGAAGLLAACRPVVLFEFEPDLAAVHGETFDDYASFLTALGYTLTQVGRADWAAEVRDNVG